MFSNIIIGIKLEISEYANIFESEKMDVEYEREYAKKIDRTIISLFRIEKKEGKKTKLLEMFLQRFVNEIEDEQFIYIGVCIINDCVSEVDLSDIDRCKTEISNYMKLHKIEKEIKMYHLMYEEDE